MSRSSGIPTSDVHHTATKEYQTTLKSRNTHHKPTPYSTQPTPSLEALATHPKCISTRHTPQVYKHSPHTPSVEALATHPSQ